MYWTIWSCHELNGSLVLWESSQYNDLRNHVRTQWVIRLQCCRSHLNLLNSMIMSRTQWSCHELNESLVLWESSQCNSLHSDVSHNTHISLSSWHDHSARYIEVTPTILQANDKFSLWFVHLAVEFVTWPLSSLHSSDSYNIAGWWLLQFVTCSLSLLHWDDSQYTDDSLSSWHDH